MVKKCLFYHSAIIEHVRDGSVVRALLLPGHHLVTVMLSGIKCPTFRRETDGSETPEPFAAEAKFFTESRLLQRDVQIILESCHNQNLLGTILHPVSRLDPWADGPPCALFNIVSNLGRFLLFSFCIVLSIALRAFPV